MEQQDVPYQQLYHACLQRCSALEAQLQRFRSLTAKLHALPQLQTVLEAVVATSKAEVAAKQVDWQRKVKAVEVQLQEMRTAHKQLTRENEQLHGRLLASQAVHKASSRQMHTRLQRTRASLHRQAAEIRQLEGSYRQKAQTVEHLQQEQREQEEFSDAERQALLEASMEQEAELCSLREALSSESVKASLCPALQQQVFGLTAELKELRMFLQQYQTQATEKMRVLKSNEHKCEVEIAELDDLVDRVRTVLRGNLAHVKQCSPLLHLLLELDGQPLTTSL